MPGTSTIGHMRQCAKQPRIDDALNRGKHRRPPTIPTAQQHNVISHTEEVGCELNTTTSSGAFKWVAIVRVDTDLRECCPPQIRSPPAIASCKALQRGESEQWKLRSPRQGVCWRREETKAQLRHASIQPHDGSMGQRHAQEQRRQWPSRVRMMVRVHASEEGRDDRQGHVRGGDGFDSGTLKSCWSWHNHDVGGWRWSTQ